MKQIFLYGIADLDGRYEIVAYSYMEQQEHFSISNVKQYATWLKLKYPRIAHVYAIDNRKGLAYEYKCTKRKNTFAENLAFRDILEREGLKVI